MGCCSSSPKGGGYAPVGDVELVMHARIDRSIEELCYSPPINNGLTGFVKEFDCLCSPDELLGTGKFSSVYECSRKKDGKRFAVKVIAGLLAQHTLFRFFCVVP